jgi:arylsulfatase
MRNDEFRGVIRRSYRDSTPWREPPLQPPPGSPNVLLIVLDDVGFAQLGCYGSDIETPRIDALAARGRRFNNFHTTAMCSPTRASLLTGRNHHAVGMGMIADWCTGYPGYQGQVTKRAATLAEMLVPVGYSCMAVGKWHLTRARDMSAAGPFGQWPLGRGFERYYGFLYSLVDQWNPELVCDNHVIPTPRRPGYHLTEDLVDQAIGMIRDQQASVPGKPFFTYLALGACHSPHQAPRRNIDKYRGRFDDGWEATRERWFQRQVELGVVPRGTRLTALSADVKPWNSMSADERRLCARHQEVFAGFLDHTDEQIGRLVDYLRTRNLLDDTLLIVLSDNGATAEGGEHGDINIRRHYQWHAEGLDEKLAGIDQLGSARLWNNYPRGWGHAGNTPHKWYKMHTHGGGIRDPLIIHWPARIRHGGLISPQFCHCSDIAPTVLEAVGIEAPKVVNGVEQMPVDGTSLAYTFEEPFAPARTRLQYFELMGNRGLWKDGWKAVTRHFPGTDFEEERCGTKKRNETTSIRSTTGRRSGVSRPTGGRRGGAGSMSRVRVAYRATWGRRSATAPTASLRMLNCDLTRKASSSLPAVRLGATFSTSRTGDSCTNTWARRDARSSNPASRCPTAGTGWRLSSASAGLVRASVR